MGQIVSVHAREILDSRGNPTVEVDVLGSISTTLTVQVWIENRNFLAALSDISPDFIRDLLCGKWSPAEPPRTRKE